MITLAPSSGEPLLMTAEVVARKLGVSPSWVRDHAEYPGRRPRREPGLRVIKLGNRAGKGLLRIHPDDLEKFIQRLRAGDFPLS